LRPSNDSTIRVLLADPQSMFLSGLGRLLDRAGLAVVALARDEETAVAFAAEHEPDVIVVDVRPPAMSGGETVRGLLEASPESRVLVLTDSAGAEDVLETVAAGACGYLLKECSLQELVACIQAAAAARSLILPSTASRLLEHARASLSPDETEDLSERELQVLRLLAEGHDNAEIAAELYISPATAKSHVSNILTKLHTQNRVQAAVYAVRAGLV